MSHHLKKHATPTSPVDAEHVAFSADADGALGAQQYGEERQLLQLQTPLLTALHGLALGPDTGLYAAGPDQLATFAFSIFGRTLAGVGDAATLRQLADAEQAGAAASAISAHVADADPHSVYTTDAEAEAIATAERAGHEATYDHDGYVQLAGLAGGQTLFGGAGPGEDLVLSSTFDATKGAVSIGGLLYVDEVNGRVGAGTETPENALHVAGDGDSPVCFIQNTDAAKAKRDVLRMENYGNVRMALDNRDSGDVWLFGTAGGQSFRWGEESIGDAFTYYSTGAFSCFSYSLLAELLRVQDDGDMDIHGHFGFTSDNTRDICSASYRAREIFCANDVINTSDEREKTSIRLLSDAEYRAWGRVSWVVYQWAAAVGKKGESARLHAGAIAQQVRDAFCAEGLDAAAYGLWCEDEIVERVLVSGPTEDSGPTYEERSVGSRLGLRYTECLVFEAAYQRSIAADLAAQLDTLSRRVAVLEAS